MNISSIALTQSVFRRSSTEQLIGKMVIVGLRDQRVFDFELEYFVKRDAEDKLKFRPVDNRDFIEKQLPEAPCDIYNDFNRCIASQIRNFYSIRNDGFSHQIRLAMNKMEIMLWTGTVKFDFDYGTKHSAQPGPPQIFRVMEASGIVSPPTDNSIIQLLHREGGPMAPFAFSIKKNLEKLEHYLGKAARPVRPSKFNEYEGTGCAKGKDCGFVMPGRCAFGSECPNTKTTTSGD